MMSSTQLLKVTVTITTTFRSSLDFYQHSYDISFGCLHEKVTRRN